jgi:hypothetical protein
MATGDVANPRIWLDGDVYYAPVGTTAPTDVTTAFSATWKALGLLSDEGLSESREEDTEDYFAWGGKLIRTVRSHHKRSFSVTALESNSAVWSLVNPGSATPVTATGITTRIAKVPTANPLAFAFHIIDGTVITRIIVPRGELVEIGDVVRGEGDIEMRELTFSVYASSTAVLYNEITNDAQAVHVP